MPFCGGLVIVALISAAAASAAVIGSTTGTSSADPPLRGERSNDPLPAGMPRVAGLSVTIDQVQPAGAGMTVDFSVQMTTQRRVALSLFSSYPINTVSASANSASVGSADTARLVTLSGGAPQHLGKLSETLVAERVDSTHRNGVWLQGQGGYTPSVAVPFTGYLFQSSERFELDSTSVRRIVGPLPGIDFGDGVTVATMELTLISTPSTVPTASGLQGTRTRVFRRSGLSHAYADQSSQQITVRSGCCSLQNFPFEGTGNATTTASFYRNRVSSFFSGYTRTYTPVSGSFLASNGQVQSRNTTVVGVSSMADSSFSSPTATVSTEPLGIDQMTAVALVGSRILEIPTVSPFGLFALAAVLAGVGVVLLGPFEA